MFLSGYYEKLEGHMMDLIPKRTASKTNPVLERIYKESIAKCVEMIRKFDETVLTENPFDEMFRTTFQSNRFI